MAQDCEQLFIENTTECTDCTSKGLARITEAICNANVILEDKFISSKIEIKTVTELPVEPEINTIYLLATEEENPNHYEVWVYVDGDWEQLDAVNLDFEDYYTKEETDEKLTAITDSINEKITDLADSIEENYLKPTDLVAGENVTFTTDEENRLVINAEGGGEEVVIDKDTILTALGYEETTISMTDENGTTKTWNILAKEVV